MNNSQARAQTFWGSGAQTKREQQQTNSKQHWEHRVCLQQMFVEY